MAAPHYGSAKPRPPEGRPSARLPHIDNLKVVLVAAIIAGHAILGYSTVGGWPYDAVREVTLGQTTQVVLAVIAGPLALFGLGAMFMLAGLVAPGAFDKRGFARFTKARMLRLGLPFAAFALLIWPLLQTGLHYAAGEPRSFLSWLIEADPLLDAGPLWFVGTLLLISLGYAAWRLTPVRDLARLPSTITARHLLMLVALVAVTTFVIRLSFPMGSTQIAQLHLWQWPQYVTLFTLGAVFARLGYAAQIPDTLRSAAGRIALSAMLAMPVLAVLGGVSDVDAHVDVFVTGWGWQAMAAAAVEGALAIGASVWLLGFAQQKFTAAGPIATAAARSAFCAYAVQAPVLFAVALAIRTVPAQAEFKAMVLALLAVPLSYVLAWVLVTRTPLGRVM